jgi:hypothetical protein
MGKSRNGPKTRKDFLKTSSTRGRGEGHLFFYETTTIGTMAQACRTG